MNGDNNGERHLLLLVSVGADLAAVLFADEHDEGWVIGCGGGWRMGDERSENNKKKMRASEKTLFFGQSPTGRCFCDDWVFPHK